MITYKPVYPLNIYYDGACGVCKNQMHAFAGQDIHQRLQFVNVNEPNFSPADHGLNPAKILDYLHAKDQKGKIAQGVDAFIWIWLACNKKVLPYLISIPVIKQIAKIVYRIFARFRYAFGKEKIVCDSNKCQHPML